MYAKWITAASAVVTLLATTIITNTASAGVITPAPPEIRVGEWLPVNHSEAVHPTLTIAQQKARQKNRTRIIEQIQKQKKMRVEQLLLLERQRNLSENRLQRQTTQARNNKLKERQPKEEEIRRRNKLLDEQRNSLAQLAQRKDAVKTKRKFQRRSQEQDIKKRFPALMHYYESLSRRILRTQKDRIAVPGANAP